MATDTLSLWDGNLNKETPSRQANPTLFPMGNGWEETCQWSPKHPGPRPVYLRTKRKENPSYATPSPPRLKSTYLSIPRTFPSGREPSLLILFHMAGHLTPVYDWPHASRRISQKRDSEIPLLSQSPDASGDQVAENKNEAQDVRSSQVNQCQSKFRSQHELLRKRGTETRMVR